MNIFNAIFNIYKDIFLIGTTLTAKKETRKEERLKGLSLTNLSGKF